MMKKYLATLIIGVIVLFLIAVVALFYFQIFAALGLSPTVGIIILLIAAIAAIAFLYVVVQRIGEIKKGEQDDLSQY